MYQIDIKTAFLNGDLNEDIYMTVPEGISDDDITDATKATTHATYATLVCKLKQTLYGLKQSP